MKELSLEQLASLAGLGQGQEGRPHLTRIAQMGVSAWRAAGRPYVWHVVEEGEGGWMVALDSGYGYIALFKGDKCLGIHLHSVHADPPEVIALDKDYYELPCYLWVPANSTTGRSEAAPL